MIATAVTLLMMVSLAQIFKVIGDSMRQGRAVLELNNRLRSVALRIRNDLENATAIVAPPADPKSGTGYLKYFDGSLTDYSGLVHAAGLSRFGDVDDILMFTARAGDVWFTGKVPRFVLTQSPPNLNTDNNGNGILDDLEPVMISSQHAEIIAFVEPIVSNDGNPARDPSVLTVDPTRFQDTDDFPGVPDGYRLHYRTLLIRPDLNGSLDGYLPATDPVFVAKPVPGLPTPLCDMAPSHALCDLSIRRVLQGGISRIAANSLEDLVNPANRFAHVQVPISGNLTMPLLALGQASSALYTAEPTGAIGVGSSFLHPAYMLQSSQIFFPGLTRLPQSRAGEDVLSSDILAFDVKAYDPGVPLIATAGQDGGPGIAGDGDATTSVFGWAGSDDLVLSPNDPGYAAAAIEVAVPSNPVQATIVGTGEYVDLGWAYKTFGSGAAGTVNQWSQLSGYSQSNFSSGFPFTDALYKSGLIVQSQQLGPNRPPLVMQPSYDTWTSSYEGDGFFQAERVNSRGVVVGTGSAPRDPWRVVSGTPVLDAGTDGLDNFNSATGVDDPTELETSPPFPTKLRGMSISIRMEDPATRTVKQMSVGKEFVTQ